MKVILDVDPGIDDAIALLIALNSPELEILAVTTVSGNVSIDKTTANALRLVEAMERSGTTPVCHGASGPLNSARARIQAESIHGTDGLGETDLPQPKSKASAEGAPDAMARLINSHGQKEIAIVATGPLTNVAALIEKEPALAKKIDCIYVMGGTFDPIVRGNVTEYAEFNFFCDPEAADIVFKFASLPDGPRAIASGLDITSTADCAVTATSLASICKLKSRAAKIACSILQYPIRTYSYFNLHDVFTLFSLLHPEIFKMDSCGGISISCTSDAFLGRCAITPGHGNIQICRTVSTQLFNRMVLDGLS